MVVGAGPGGVAASLQAARMGARVALLEETDMVGGQITAGGVGSMDEGGKIARNSGIYKEFSQAAIAFYKAHHKSYNTCYFGADSLCITPTVGQTILKQMLAGQAHNLQVFTHTSVTGVTKHGNSVTGVTAGQTHYNAKVVIDASEYGDVLAQAGAPFRLGRTATTKPAEAGPSCLQSATYTAIIKKYLKGLPKKLTFKQPPPGYSSERAAQFAKYVTNDGNDHFVTPKTPMSFQSFVAYRGLPDLSNPNDYNVFQPDGHEITRTALNFGNDFPLQGSLKPNIVTDRQARQKQTCQAKLLTLQMMYYIQHDLGQTSWSVADDEGYNTAYNTSHRCPELQGFEAFEDNMPQQLYMREARRVIGTSTLTGQQLQYSWKDRHHTPTYPDSIAVGYYPMDLHGCSMAKTLESDLDAPGNMSGKYAGGAFEVPMGTLIPQDIDGLLTTEKNISTSRLANGAVREQPIAMATGQASGALAALAVRQHKKPRQVDAQTVRTALTNNQAVVSIHNNYAATPKPSQAD